MRVVKNTVVTAFAVGSGSALEDRFIKEGKIRNNGQNYEVFSSEVKGDKGEIISQGDMVIIDCKGMPYPNSRQSFFENYISIGQDRYRNVRKEMDAWTYGEPVSKQLQSILNEKRLMIQEDKEEEYFKAKLWGTTLTAAKNDVIIFYNDGYGADCDFNFVKREVFEETYSILD